MTQKGNGQRLTPGVILIIIGVVLLLKKLNLLFFDLPARIFSWEGILILIGLVLFQNPGQRRTAFILFAIAFIGFFPNFWPLLLIAVGISMVIRGSSGNYAVPAVKAAGNADINDFITDISIFGGGKKIFRSDSFTGGRMTAIFGGSEIDLTECQLAPGVHSLETTVIFGGYTIKMPDDWDVQVRAQPLFGGIDDERKREMVRNSANAELKRLVLNGIVLFGGVSIKN